MDDDRFWALVAEIEPTVADDPLAFDEALSEALVELPPEEVVAFANTWTRMANRAFTWDLWAAAWLLRGDALDWEFTGFRDRLIALGRTVFERALAEADSLADVPVDWRDGDEGGDVWLSLAAGDAFERLTGEDIADAEPAEEAEPPEPSGEPWRRLDEFEDRVPRIAANAGPLKLPDLMPCPRCGHLTLWQPEGECDICRDGRPPRPWEMPRA